MSSEEIRAQQNRRGCRAKQCGVVGRLEISLNPTYMYCKCLGYVLAFCLT